MTNYWFKPKTHGYGATPSNWKGWAAIAAFGLAQLLLVLLLQSAGADPDKSLGWVLGVVGIMAVVTATFIWVTRIKTDGEWRWRWPQKSK